MIHSIFLIIALALLTSCQAKNEIVIDEHLRVVGFSRPAGPIKGERNIVLESGDLRAEIRPLDAKKETASKNLLRLNMENLFHPSLAPYPGVISDKVACPKAFLPTELSIEGTDVAFSGYRLFATGRRGLGACSKENAKYIAHQGLLKCQAKGHLFEILFFSSSATGDSDFTKFLKDVRCL